MTDPLYIKWVQRSLNRLNNAGLSVDGLPGDRYRDEVARFKRKYTINEPGLTGKQIGEKCQSQIILQNHLNTEYASWVRKVLPNAPPQASPADGLPEAEIRAFQSKQSLKVNGWVGYKTELRLIQISVQEPPVSGGGGGAPAANPWVIWFNSLPKEKKYIHMMEIAAKDYAAVACDFHIKSIAQKLRGSYSQTFQNDFYFFTWELVQYLRAGSPKREAYAQLRKYLKPADNWFGRDHYEVKNPAVQEILRLNYMKSTATELHPHYAYPIISMEHYNQNYSKFFKEIENTHYEVDRGIGEVKKERGRHHGEPTMELAQNLMIGLSNRNLHIYSCYKDQMPGGFEGPF